MLFVRSTGAESLPQRPGFGRQVNQGLIVENMFHVEQLTGKSKKMQKIAIKFPQFRLTDGTRVYFSARDVERVKERAELKGPVEIFQACKKQKYLRENYKIVCLSVEQAKLIFPEIGMSDEDEKEKRALG